MGIKTLMRFWKPGRFARFARPSPAPPVQAERIDPRTLIRELSVEQHRQLAEQYFARLSDHENLLAKPFFQGPEAGEVLQTFSQVLHGLDLAPGMTVLDFGAGSCWAARWLTQLGCAVIALDVSPTALEIGQELYRRQPVFGNQPAPRFLCFDGHTIDLPDQSVDRVLCNAAFHHVPNQERVMRELGRILKQGGIAGFVEPGPEHSRSPQAQYEMRQHRVLENDILMKDIWTTAQAAGFTDLKLAVFNLPQLLPLAAYEDFVYRQKPNAAWVESTRATLRDRRVFFLYKGEGGMRDSRQSLGLCGALQVEMAQTRVPRETLFSARGTATNTGQALWLPITASLGPVQLGVHLLDEAGQTLNHDFHRQVLTPAPGRPILPGETVPLATTIPAPPPGRYRLEFDLVAEGVGWFASTGSRTISLAIEVV